jgi:hypothetical protein
VVLRRVLGALLDTSASVDDVLKTLDAEEEQLGASVRGETESAHGPSDDVAWEY